MRFKLIFEGIFMKKSYLLLVVSSLMISGCSNFFAKNKPNNQVVKNKPVKSIQQNQPKINFDINPDVVNLRPNSRVVDPVFLEKPRTIINQSQPVKKPVKPVTVNQSVIAKPVIKEVIKEIPKPAIKPTIVSKNEIAKSKSEIKKEIKPTETKKLVNNKSSAVTQTKHSVKPIAKPVLKKTENVKSNQKSTKPTESKPVTKSDNDNKLVNKLKEQAKKAIEARQYDRAVGFLENAQRLERKNIKILFDIANIKAHQKKWSESESYASRVIQIGGDKAILKKAWLLLAEVREKLGDEQGAKTAKQRASKIK